MVRPRPYVRRNCIACLLTVPDDGSGSADLELAARSRYFFRSVQPKEDFLLSAEIRKRATLTNHFCRKRLLLPEDDLSVRLLP